MRITLNLATKPYVELKPLYLRLRWAMGLLLLMAVGLGLILRVEARKAAEAHARVTALNQQIAALKQEQQSFQSQMRQPQNASVLGESEFLNELFKRKSFSWTAVMMDLETVLPGGVQVTSLEPSILPGGGVTIRMRVSGQRDMAVELIKNLEHSKRFLLPRLANETADTAATGPGSQAALRPVSASSSVNFDILADYNPLPATSDKTATKSPDDKGVKKTAPHTGGTKKAGPPGKIKAGHSAAATPPPAAGAVPPRPGQPRPSATGGPK